MVSEVITHLSIRESLIVVAIALGCASLSLNTLSMTDSSVLVVSSPVKAHQSFTTIPAAMTSLPRFTVPACGVPEKGRFGNNSRTQQQLDAMCPPGHLSRSKTCKQYGEMSTLPIRGQGRSITTLLICIRLIQIHMSLAVGARDNVKMSISTTMTTTAHHQRHLE